MKSKYEKNRQNNVKTPFDVITLKKIFDVIDIEMMFEFFGNQLYYIM